MPDAPDPLGSYLRGGLLAEARRVHARLRGEKTPLEAFQWLFPRLSTVWKNAMAAGVPAGTPEPSPQTLNAFMATFFTLCAEHESATNVFGDFSVEHGLFPHLRDLPMTGPLYSILSRAIHVGLVGRPEGESERAKKLNAPFKDLSVLAAELHFVPGGWYTLDDDKLRSVGSAADWEAEGVSKSFTRGGVPMPVVNILINRASNAPVSLKLSQAGSVPARARVSARRSLRVYVCVCVCGVCVWCVRVCVWGGVCLARTPVPSLSRLVLHLSSFVAISYSRGAVFLSEGTTDAVEVLLQRASGEERMQLVDLGEAVISLDRGLNTENVRLTVFNAKGHTLCTVKRGG